MAAVEQVPWATRVARALADAQPELEFHNLGWRGLRAAEIRDQQLGPALEVQPDLVSIAAEATDLLVPEFSRDAVARDLEPIYAAFARTQPTMFTFTYMNLPGSGLMPPEAARWLSDRMDILHSAITALAQRHGAILIDLHSNPAAADPRLFSHDLQHANAAGHAWVTDRIIEVLAGEIRRPARRNALVEHDPPSTKCPETLSLGLSTRAPAYADRASGV